MPNEPSPEDATDLAAITAQAIRALLPESGPITASAASALASLLRVAISLQRPPESTDEALLEVERRAHLMHGLPPRTPEEWAWAESRFSAEAVAEFRRWAASGRYGATEGEAPAV